MRKNEEKKLVEKRAKNKGKSEKIKMKEKG